jgi:D-xylose transport system ATP-binding protein
VSEMTINGKASRESATGNVLEVHNAVKRFGAVTAVNDVSFTLCRGEVLALLGDNGAGKSTMIKSICGVVELDEGEILLDGRPVQLRSPGDARLHGIETVYQDLSLFDDLGAVANLFAGRELGTPRWPKSASWLSSRRMNAQAKEILDRLEVYLPGVQSPVRLLSGGQRQAIAVARAVHFATRLVILDEPTAALGVRETRNVLRMVKRLPEHGISVILISHNLDQVAEVADRVVVMRRGRKVGEARPDPASHDEIIRMIVGG